MFVSVRRLRSRIAFAIVTTSLVAQGLCQSVAKAEFLPYCQQTIGAIQQKDAARRAALNATPEAQQSYQSLIRQQAEQLRQCRSQNWLKTQGLWLRLYACDTRPGAIDEVLDRIVDRGYNEIYVETFFNGQVLLPAANNPTAWQSMVQSPNNADLLAQVIQKGRDRGLKVYAWMFSMNFGYTYAIKPEKQVTLLRNGRGQTSFSANTVAGLSTDLGTLNPDEAFIDPYSLPAKQDYYRMVQEVLKRKPDGVLFDYIRYPRSRGKQSITTGVQDLWIFGEASRQALIDRGLNNKGRELIKRYIGRGLISASDVATVDKLFPREKIPMWQGRIPSAIETRGSSAQRAGVLQADLWRLSVAHAMQGVVDFLNLAIYPVRQAGLPAGAVFFPEGNQMIGQGYDSRLQPWDRFPRNIAWHPMSYATCGNANCIVQQVQRVLAQAAPGTEVKPVLAGVWQESISNRPPLEVQMEALRSLSPRISAISHFAYSWQEPQSDQDRKYCATRRL
ncbi:family 10 glycosylhydrolase [Cyanobacteria bacterium FACHB-63]|nr:family 10 glycosylhydrolase [Cyanobacteria bacterium FACHB-63]